MASRLARWTARRVAEQAAAEGLALEMHHVVLAEIAVDVGYGLLDCAPRAGAARAVAAVERADVLVAVSPVHNASYSALFKAFLDQVPRGTLAGVPTLMALAGGSQRHGLVLDHVMRPLPGHLARSRRTDRHRPHGATGCRTTCPRPRWTPESARAPWSWWPWRVRPAY
ncbi:MAG: NAD(P)H-dependent oxidoreductase [Austwickia sp.]|nr:NAD(P)H-dependent oxidoreductase [Austwickia sp.]